MVVSELKWSTVSISEIIPNKYRLEASYYGYEGRKAREVLKNCKWDITSLCGLQGLATAYHRPRFKRIFVNKSEYPIYQPSQINHIYPKPDTFISNKTATSIEDLRVHKGQILLTCSGTIGNCTLVSSTLNNNIFSHDLIRINPKDPQDTGYLYTYLKSKIGNALITSNNYGAVVDHIEPEHLEFVPIPNPPFEIKSRINEKIIKSFDLRDESNILIDEAQMLLKDALNLPDFDDFNPIYYNNASDVKNFSIPLSDLNSRFDASYHVPIVDEIINHLAQYSRELATISDERISKSVILPGRFKRIYVNEGHGAVFFGGKQIYELDPSNKKYLSTVHHEKRIKDQLLLFKNMTLITCSGTVGKVAIVPKHWEGWAANQHIIRVIPQSKEIAGYLYTWLSSKYAFPLISRFTYGAVVDEIDANHVSEIPVPLLEDVSVQKEINDKVLEANQKRAEAYYLEQEALEILESEVIKAT